MNDGGKNENKYDDIQDWDGDHHRYRWHCIAGVGSTPDGMGTIPSKRELERMIM